MNPLWKLVAFGFVLWSASSATAVAAQQLGGCVVDVQSGSLSVVGNDAPNAIVIFGIPDGVQVTCDGASASYAGVSVMFVFAGAGDDAFELGHLEELRHLESFGPIFDGGVGNDALTIVGSALADRFDIGPLREAGSAEIRLTDVATETHRADVFAFGVEVVSVISGDGEDEFRIGGVAGTHLKLFGGNGNDSAGIDVLLGNTGADALIDWAGEFGHDEFKVIGSKADELYRLIPLPDRERPDPHIRVTDSAGVVIADLFVQETEEIEIEAGDGDDRFDVLWDAVHMSGVGTLRADLGDGNDTMNVDLVPVLLAPPGGDVQTAFFDVIAGQGDDEILFDHAAGGWFDVAFTAGLGNGSDRFQARLQPPPDDGAPAPEGARRIAFAVFSGNEDDFVGVENDAGDLFFHASVTAELGRGNDVFEGSGLFELFAQPGRGFDTARVTRNLLPFVADFEGVEALQ